MFYGSVSLQGIVPESAMRSVKELFVKNELKAAAVTEAESLPRLDITQARSIMYTVRSVRVGYIR